MTTARQRQKVRARIRAINFRREAENKRSRLATQQALQRVQFELQHMPANDPRRPERAHAERLLRELFERELAKQRVDDEIRRLEHTTEFLAAWQKHSRERKTSELMARILEELQSPGL